MDCQMLSLVITFLVAFSGSLLLTPAIRLLAGRMGALDQPDGNRKLHVGLTPLWGGVAVYLAIALGLGVAMCGSFGRRAELTDLSLALLLAAGIVCVCGAIDDRWCLGPRLKLLLQICSVLPIVAMGYSVDRIVAFSYPIELGWFAIPLTVVWLVGCINALNLLDGMDGLASTVGLVTAVMMAIIAVSAGNTHVAVVAIVLAAALAGFLFYNLPPASIFLGDSGSMVIGLMVGVLAIQGSLKTSTTLSIAIPAVIMSLPLFDTVLAVVRRKLTGQPFDQADRKHIHHRLLDRGLSQWQVLCVIGSLCLVTGAAATAATILRNDALAWITALALMVLMIRLRLFGHYEVALLKNAAAKRLTRLANYLAAPGVVGDPLHPADLEEMPFGRVWDLLIDDARTKRIRRIELTSSAEGQPERQFHWQDADVDLEKQNQCWMSATFIQSRGRSCELRATLPDADWRKPQHTVGVERLLLVFGSYFANHAEDMPGLSLIAENDSKQPDGDQKKAA
jgi:UDP-GlcNAc:undecaprenyl-phosphate GlcNAc-1-phosphate transferase